MILYILYCIIDILFNIIAYVTNPIVCLFANEVGELPPIFRWWANWDDNLDVSWMVTQHHVPRFAEYDFHRHYVYYDEWQAEKITGQHHGFVILLDPNFTIKERIQRYFCRLTWLYRNCAYGFSYHVTGRVVNGIDVEVITDNKYCYYGRCKHWLTIDPFCFYMMRPWNPKDVSWLRWTGIDHKFYLKIFFGWKFQHIKTTETKRSMLALFAYPFK